MESLSFEERMKIYKDKYSGGNSASGKKNLPNSKGSSKNMSKHSGGNRKGSQNYRQNSPYSKSAGNPAQQKQKMGLFARIKSFFGR